MEISYDITSIGELLVDMTPYDDSLCSRPLYEANAGGAPCNVIAMASRLGSRCSFIGKVGRDAFGDMLMRTVSDIGIDTSGISFDETVPTMLALIALGVNNERSFVFYRNPGADSMLSADDVGEEQVAASSILHFGAMSFMNGKSRGAVIKAIETAKKFGRILSFDPNIREFLLADDEGLRATLNQGFSFCDVLKLSEEELLYCTGINDTEKAVEALTEKYPRISIIFLTLGSMGSLVVKGDEYISVPGFLQPTIVDTTGAGDAFYGVCLHYIAKLGLSGLDTDTLKNIARQANAAGSIVVGRRGALLSMPSFDDINAITGNC